MDFVRALKKNKEQVLEQEQIDRSSNRMLVFILVLVSIVFTTEYVLITRLIEIIKNFS